MNHWQDDQDTALVKQHFAVVYTPSQRRKRFPDNCVEVMDSAEAALSRAKDGGDLHPALVMGPSRSSEGFMLYYLVRWLN